MKQYLRNRISKTASYLEIFLSVLILAGILIMSVALVRDLITGVASLFASRNPFDFRNYLSLIIQLIIGIEFVKMISKHTPESMVEVLLFVVARKILVNEPDYWEIAIGILAIAVLFVIKEYFTQKTNPEGCILQGDTDFREVNAMLGTHFTAENGKTAREIVMSEINRREQNLQPGLEVPMDQVVFKVYSLKNQAIDAVEAVPRIQRNFWRRLFKRS